MDFWIFYFGYLLAFSSSAAWGRSTDSGQTTGGKQQQTLAPDFTCPEEFGYFPHPEDCTQYYVCVFGGALLESCTGGLMYSHDLQTCDWPRNVNCGGTNGGVLNVTQYVYDRSGTAGSGGASFVETSIRDRGDYIIPVSPSRATDIIRTRQPPQQHQVQQQVQQPEERVLQRQPLPQASLNDNSDLVVGNVVSTSPRYTNIRFQDDNQADGSRLGRSYEQNVPNYKEEIYNAVGSDEPSSSRHSIVKRQIRYGPNPGHDNMYPSSYWRQRDLDFGTYANQHAHQHRLIKSPYVGRPHFSPNRYNTNNPTTASSSYPSHVHHNHHHQHHHHRQPQPSSLPPHRLQPLPYNPPPHRQPIQLPIAPHEQPQSHENNYDSDEHSGHEDDDEDGGDEHSAEHGGSTSTLRPYGTQEGSTLRPYGNQHNHHNHHHHHRLVVPRPPVPTPPLVPHSTQQHQQRYRLSPTVPTTTTTTTTTTTLRTTPKVHLLDGFQPSSFWPHNENSAEDVGHSNSKESDEGNHTHDSGGHEDDDNDDHLTDSDPSNSPLTIDDISVNGNGKTTPSHSQQEIIIDPEYLSQRYAANVQPVANATANLYYDDSAYYIYDEEKEEPTYDDVDYKSSGQQVQPQQQQQQPQRTTQPQPLPVIVETTTTTRRPLPPPTTSTAKPSRGSSRGTARHKSGSNSNRPTLKPSSSLLKDVQVEVRDVYADPPSRPAPVYETPVPNSPATKCRSDECVLPDCFCGGKHIPGGLPASQVPQIVLLTFDDSVNDLNKDLYRDLFEKGRKNPNGCPISATFYVSHEWTDYSQVQNLAADGHEIASHSVSHSFGEQFSQKKWDKEIGGQREILAAYGGVKLSEIRGMRAPFLAIGGNNMFKMLYDSNFTYDSSMPIYENKPPSWPYTLDHKIFHDCMIPPCPTKSYPGVWEVPMVMWQDLKGGRCSMGDACSNPPTAEGVYNMLAKNFERHYTTNRAPFGLYYHAAWFTQPHHKEGFEAFLDTLVNMDDVFIITNWQALQWVRNPTPLSQILNFEPWSCHNKRDRPPRCNHPKVCNLWHKSGVRYMKTCQQCPPQYPWVGNTGVPVSNSL